MTGRVELIEWRHDLLPLTARDASADVANLADAFDFRHPDPTVPALPLPPPPPPNPCGPTNPSPLAAGRDTTWADLRRSGVLNGWVLS